MLPSSQRGGPFQCARGVSKEKGGRSCSHSSSQVLIDLEEGYQARTSTRTIPRVMKGGSILSSASKCFSMAKLFLKQYEFFLLCDRYM